MKDYLGRAVERAQGISAGVRPALPSLFDPGPTSDPSAFPETERLLRPNDPPRAPDELPKEISPAGARTGVDEKPRLDVPLSPAGKGAAKDKQISADPIRSPTIPLEVQVRPTAIPSTPEGSTKQSAEQDSDSARETELQPMAGRANESPSGRLTSSPVPTTTPKSASPAVVIAPAKKLITRTTIPASHSPPPGNAVRRNGRHAFVNGNSASAPPIHVTIGRVEIRAVHARPESTPPRPSPPSSKISLDDYLRSRTKGAA